MTTSTTGIAGGGVRALRRLAVVLGIAAALLAGQAAIGGSPASAAPPVCTDSPECKLFEMEDW